MIIEQFLVKLRKHNPKAHIIWAYGMLGFPMMPAIYRAVDAYTKRTGDLRATIIQLPNTNEDMIGARSHPGELSHRSAAEALAEYIRGIKG